jgi:peptidoglycan/LPS O-acetylase OafA/YrhL
LTPVQSERYASLDGLRGLAALVVVVYHSTISTPRAAAIRLSPGEQDLTPLELVLACTPLRLLWSGSEAVVIFFVLSGFVLALPYARSGGMPNRYFYPRRLLRLYVPAAASLVFAYLTALVVPRLHLAGASAWVNLHAELANGPREVVLGSSLIYGWGGLNLSLWSLRWEVVFSTLLALFLLFARLWPKGVWVKIVTVVLACSLWPIAGLFSTRTGSTSPSSRWGS